MESEPETGPVVQAELMGRPILPAIAAILYGAYNFYELGFDIEHYLWTYILVIGGAASILCVGAYLNVVRSPPGRSWPRAFAALGGLVPYSYSLYLMVFLGAFTLWRLVANDFSIGRLLFGLFWVVAGWRMLYTFWIITEIGGTKRGVGR